MEQEDEVLDFDSEFSLDVQKRFLTLLIYEQQWSDLYGLEIVKPECFDNKLLKTICKWIHDIYKEYNCAPTMPMLCDVLTNYINSDDKLSQKQYYQFKDIFDEIFMVGENENLDFFKDRAIDFSKQVAWKKAMEKASKLLTCKRYGEAMKLFSDIIQIGAENNLGIDFTDLNLNTFLQSLDTQYDPSSMIHTGVPSWDKALGGGFVKDNIHIIGAAPGHGKSKIMSYLTKKALEEGKRVVFITLELTEEETMQNILMSAIGTTMYDLRDKENRERMLSKISAFRDNYKSDLMIKFYKPATVTADVIHNYIQRVIQRKRNKYGVEWKPDVIFLDYMDKLLPTNKIKGSIYEDNGNVADDCKNLAIDFSCPVITGSQLGRASWNLRGDEVISMASIAESAKKAHLAHSLTTINANPNEKELGKSRLYIAKSRTGTPGKVIYMEHNLGRNIFYETDPWTQDQLESTTSYTVKDTTATNVQK